MGAVEAGEEAVVVDADHLAFVMVDESLHEHLVIAKQLLPAVGTEPVC